MKKSIIFFICCCVVLLSGCSAQYKRISFNNDTLDGPLNKYINDNTTVINDVKKENLTQFPVYKISEREISEEEVQEMFKQLGFDFGYASTRFKLDGNRISGTLYNFTDRSRKHYDEANMTEAELEKLAWDTFKKIPFLEGTYEYMGIRGEQTRSDSEGTHLVRVGVSFQRVIDGIRVLGEDECFLYFDGDGLVEIYIELYDYEKTGTLDLVPLEDASSKIKDPDSFILDDETSISKFGGIDTLQTEKVNLLFYNQYSDGCTILQPVYAFIGTATSDKGEESGFKSVVIAIPDSYTYD